jgi:tRNA G18 (ribose-2'-O)-methylase SpoU
MEICKSVLHNRGFFEIGVFHPKTEENIGTLWRTAYQLGASGVFTIGRRYRRQASDTPYSSKHIPLRHFDTFDEFDAARPYNCPLIGIEMGGRPLSQMVHPMQATYLLGSEDSGIPQCVLNKCQHIVSLESVRMASYNVAVAGSLVMYHRVFAR